MSRATPSSAAKICSTEEVTFPPLLACDDLEVSPRAPLIGDMGKRSSLFESFDASQINVGKCNSHDACLVETTSSFQLPKTDTTGNILSDQANMLRVCGRINSIVSKVNRVLQKQGGIGNPYASPSTPSSTPRTARLQPLNVPSSPSKAMCRKSSFTDDDIAGLYTSTPCPTPTHALGSSPSTLLHARVSNSNINNWMKPDELHGHIDRTASTLHSKSEADGEYKVRALSKDARICSPSIWALSLSQGVSKSSSGSAASSPCASRNSSVELNPSAALSVRLGKEAVGTGGIERVGGAIRLRSMQARHAIQQATASQSSSPGTPVSNRDKRRFST